MTPSATRRVAVQVAAVALLGGGVRGAGGQALPQPRREPRPRPRLEVRADALVARSAAAQAGLGVETDAGLYARLAAVGGVGGDRWGASVRGEAIARFILDPLRQARRGPYLGGGAGVRRDGRGDTRAYLLAVVGVEGKGPGATRLGWAPAIEVGIGGGARLSLVLRRARPDAR